jgi:enoyl-CoA hydratase/carnithine racemase
VSQVEVTLDGGVCEISVDNPPINALSHDLLVELSAVVSGIANDSAVRAVVITSQCARSFFAGASIDELPSLRDPLRLEDHMQMTRGMFDTLSSLPQPTIAAVEAAAVGGGLEVALACDLLYANAGVTLGFPEVRLGLIPGAGGTQRLARKVGASRALAMIGLGQMIKADTPAAVGIVDRVFHGDDGARAGALTDARRFSSLPARAVQAAKRLVHLDGDRGLTGDLDAETQVFKALFDSDDFQIGVDAFLKHQTPEFQHR